MGKITEKTQWDEDIYLIETSDPVQGGENGINNKAAQGLSNRTQYLKRAVEEVKDVADSAIPNAKKSSSVTSTSTETVATSQAVKTAHDKGEKAENLANNANNAMTKLQRATLEYVPVTVKNMTDVFNQVDGRYIVAGEGDHGFPTTMTGTIGTITIASRYDVKLHDSNNTSPSNWKHYTLYGAYGGVWVASRLNGRGFSGWKQVITHDIGDVRYPKRTDISTSTTSTSTTTIASSSALKVVSDNAKQAMAEALKKHPKFTPSDTVTSTSTTQVANVGGVKKAYDKGANAESLANNVNNALTKLQRATLEYVPVTVKNMIDVFNQVDGRYIVAGEGDHGFPTTMTGTIGTITIASRYGVKLHDSNNTSPSNWKHYTLYGAYGGVWVASRLNGGSFSDWKQIITHDIGDKIYASKAGLIGVPIPYPSSIVPSGYLAMQGQAISSSAYPKLYALYGGRLPDMRGEFIRGWDNGRGVDSGRGIRSSQGDAIRNISGYFPTSSWATTPDDRLFKRLRMGEQDGDGSGRSGWVMQFDASQVVPTANENRPRNIAFQYICLAG